MDIIGADFLNVIETMRDRLQANAVAIQLPIGAESDFTGIIDLVEQKHTCSEMIWAKTSK